MSAKGMKNLSMTKRFVIIYIHIAVWTLPYIIGAVILINLLSTSAPNEYESILTSYLGIAVIYTLVYFLITGLLGRSLRKHVINPLKNAVKDIEKISAGHLDVEFDSKGGSDEIAQLMQGMDDLVKALREQRDILYKLAAGDYTEEVVPRNSTDDMFIPLKRLNESSVSVIARIKDASSQISKGSIEIASGAQNLASGSTEQASTIEEFSASIADIKDKADENARTAQITLDDISDNTKLMQENITEIKKVNVFIDELADSSKQIAKVIKVIDDIAFQTNILALNAAVEAARAGEHGKGFAVVADEVRELASKSAEAAKETSKLIKESLDAANEGSALVAKTNAGIDLMGDITEKNQASVIKMSEVSIEQGNSITVIDQGIGRISDVIQANSSMAQESAAAAQEMSAQANQLSDMIETFKLKEEKVKRHHSENLNLNRYNFQKANVDMAQRYKDQNISFDTSGLSLDGSDDLNPGSNDDTGLGSSDDLNAESVEKADISDYYPETSRRYPLKEDKPSGYQVVDATGPELEDFSEIKVPDKY